MAIIIGTAGPDTRNGTENADFIDGQGGDDILNGRGGSDIIVGGTGNDTVTGGEGDDTYIFNVTTDGSDSVDLGTGEDVALISADAPTNVRITFTSSQVGNANPNDSNTMANQDGGLAVRLQAEDGSGNLTGPVSRFDDEGISFRSDSAGLTFDVRDLVSGAARGDQFDVVTLATSGDDVIREIGETERYYINAGMGNDSVIGGVNNDFLVGGAGNDFLNGGRGDDSFIGGTGNDRINGDVGDDLVIFNVSTDGSDRVTLGEGDDVVAVSAAPGVTQVRLTFTSNEVGNGNSAASDTQANQDAGLAVRLQAEDGSGNLTGPMSRFDDEGISFESRSPGVTFEVRDLVSGVSRGDQFDVVTLATSGDDVISETGETSRYYINAGMGNDSVIGGVNNDFLVGGAGNDFLNGGRGDDSFIGGTGNDRINGDVGDDLVIFNVSTYGSDQVTLGAGDDVVAVSAAPGVTQVRLTFTSNEVGNGNAAASNTQANQDAGLAVRLQAEDGSDNLTGPVSRFDDEGISFESRSPGLRFDVRDLVTGAQRGNQFEVVTLGTSGDDNIDETGESRAYYINAGMGNDTVTGGNANDFLVGGAGNDELNGGDGNDGFIGGGGSDEIDGGAGDDTAIVNVSNDGADQVNLGSGSDVVAVSGAPGVTQVRLTFTSSEVGNGNPNDSNTMPPNQDGALAVRFQAEDSSGVLTGPVSRYDDEGISVESRSPGLRFDVRDLVSGAQRGNQFEVVTLGTNGDDTIDETGETRAYYINAGMGNDTVTGGNANDFLVGGAGADTLNGGDGNDSFIGGGGNDTHAGGNGSDTFIFAPAFGTDTILDFEDMVDMLVFDPALGMGTTTVDGEDRVISFSDGSSVRLVGVEGEPVMSEGGAGITSFTPSEDAFIL